MTRPFGRTSCVARRGGGRRNDANPGGPLRNYSHPRCADALAAAGGARCRSHRADGLHDDAVDRQLAAGAPAGTHVGRDAGRDRRLLPRESGRYARGRRERLRAARGTWPAGTTWRRPMPCIPGCCASRRRLPRRRSGSHLRRPHSRKPLAWPATGVVATPFSAGKTRGLVIAASGLRPFGAGRGGRARGVRRIRRQAYGPLVILKHENEPSRPTDTTASCSSTKATRCARASRSPKWAPTRAAARRSSSKSARTARSSIR